MAGYRLGRASSQRGFASRPLCYESRGICGLREGGAHAGILAHGGSVPSRGPLRLDDARTLQPRDPPAC